MSITAAQTTPLIPRRVLFGNPERTAARLSPDGKQLAYLAPSNGVLNVWVRSIDGIDARAVTADRERPIRGYFWQPGGGGIVHVQDKGGDENFHVFLTDLTTGQTRDLTPFDGARADIIDVDRNHPNEMLVGINARDARYFDVYRIAFQTGEATMIEENPGDVAGWTADNNLQIRVAHVVRPDGGTRLRIRTTAGDAWQDFLEAGAEETLEAYGFDDRGRLLIASSLEANAARLFAYDLSNGERELLAEDARYDVGGVLLNPRTYCIEGISFERQRTEWTALAPSIAADIEVIAQISHGDWNIGSRDYEDQLWTVDFVVDNGPIQFYLYDRASRKATFLFTNQPELENFPLAQMQPVQFPARDRLLLEGYLSLPQGHDASAPGPLILLVHGGPWARDTWGYRADVQWLVNRGYGVLQVNYRGSTGYGKHHLNAGDREWAGKMHDDLLDAKAWAIAQHHADPARVAIYGGSYGGYATLVGLSFTPDAFACGVDIVGPSSLLTLINSIPPYWETALAQFKRRVGDPEKDQVFLEARSPLSRAGEITAPLLIGQGANDPRVKITESDQIVKAMRENGKTVEYLVFEDEGHGFARPENRMRFYAAVEMFLAEHLGGRAQAAEAGEELEPFRR